MLSKSSEPLISAKHLSFRAAGTDVLKDVGFEVRAGEIVTLIGPNGSGKTSLLKALLGLAPASGEIVRKPGLRIGYVPQNFPRDMSLPMTVGRFTRLFADRCCKVDAALARRRASPPLLRQRSARLSGGELARVMLARAIAGKRPGAIDPR